MTKEIIETTTDVENKVLYEFTVNATLQVPVDMNLDAESIVREHPMIQEGANKIYAALNENFCIARNKKGDEKILINSQYFFGGEKISVIAYSGKT